MSGGAAGPQIFVYDGNALIGEYNVNGDLLRRYVHGGNMEADDPIAWFEGAVADTSTIRLAKVDPRGSIIAWTDASGNSLATNSYDEYGVTDSLTQSDPDGTISAKGRFRYTRAATTSGGR